MSIQHSPSLIFPRNVGLTN